MLPVTLCAQADTSLRLASLQELIDQHGALEQSLVLWTQDAALAGLEQARFIKVKHQESGHPEACTCCAGSAGVGSVLRDVFLLALRRQIPRFSQVLIEVPPVASLSAVRNVLRYDAFVAQRYRLERILDQGRGNLESGSKGVLGLGKL